MTLNGLPFTEFAAGSGTADEAEISAGRAVRERVQQRFQREMVVLRFCRVERRPLDPWSNVPIGHWKQIYLHKKPPPLP